MAQRGSNRNKRAQTYSQDTLMLRLLAGLALIALGVVIFLAVDLRMQGNVFQGLKVVCFGLCGSLALALPVFPVWAGILVIWSTQKRAPVRPWVFSLLCYVAVCAFIMLISPGAMEHLSRQYGAGWGNMITGGYSDCSRTGTGGGAVGVALAWLLWAPLKSTFLGAVVFFLLIVFCLLMAVGLTPMKIKALATGQAGRLREQQQQQRQRQEEQQLAWQQQQALAQQAWQQQQQAILEQQQQQAWPQQQPVPDPRQPGASGQPAFGQAAGYSGAQPVYEQQDPQWNRSDENGGYSGNSSVEAWQEQMTAHRAAQADPAYQSVILNRKAEPAKDTAEKTWKSRIFGKKDAEDGLVDPASAEEADPHSGNTGKVRRTATGERITGPATQWSSVTREAEVAAGQNRKPETETDSGRFPGRKEPVQTDPAGPEETDRSFEAQWNRGPDGPADPVPQGKRKSAAQRNPEAPSAAGEKRTTDAGKDKGRSGSGWKDQVQEAIEAERRAAEEEAAAPAGKEKTAVPVPVATEIGAAAYRPALNLPKTAEEDEGEAPEWTPTPYYVPPITDLKAPSLTREDTAMEDAMRSRRLEETLASFKVQARVVNVTHGPAISRFEMELAAGTKVGKVAELEKDIAYGMEATSVRIEAPIPGKSLVGVEVPNRKVDTVTLREVLESEKMQTAKAKSILTVALGKDIAGTPIVCDLARMPHMLIAGQTGSGKSVCINAIINSLLYNEAGPDHIKLILVDPKVVELQCYNEIPHLLIPVVNDPHKAAAALAWAVAEMMDRYDQFARRKVRNLDGYNSVLEPGEKPMARIVIIIDELADLMMVCKKDVEEYICRLTQLARAAGIHLIVATQRPSVDVITGLIKANIPSRIAFKTASSVDSRTILDRNGSEQLLGWGDMLYLPTGSFAPTRVQGCFLSDEEVNRVVGHVRQYNPCGYDQDILDKLEQIAGGSEAEPTGADLIGGYGGDSGSGDSNLFEQAVEYAIQDGQISTSTLQRRLKIGYARAGRLTDEMEERGIVAAKDGSKPRKCLITREEWEEMKKSTEGMA